MLKLYAMMDSALVARLTELDWIRAARGDRAVTITSAGRDGLNEVFGVSA